MIIEIRSDKPASKRKQAIIRDGRMNLYLGYLGETERKSLAKQFINAAEALLDGLDEQETAGAEGAFIRWNSKGLIID